MKRTLLPTSGATLMNCFARRSKDLQHIFGFAVVPAALVTTTLAQNNQPPRSPDPPVLIWDIDLKLAKDIPRNFRTTNDPPNEVNGETPVITGLTDLRASGSGEFSVEGSESFAATNAGSRNRVRLAPGNAPICQ